MKNGHKSDSRNYDVIKYAIMMALDGEKTGRKHIKNKQNQVFCFSNIPSEISVRHLVGYILAFLLDFHQKLN